MRLLLLSFSILLVTGCAIDKASPIHEINSPAGQNSSLPFLYTDNSGTLFMSWIEESGGLAKLKYATFDGTEWTPASVIASDSTWFLNWADYPSIIAQNGQPMAAHWLNKKAGGTYSYDVNIGTFDNNWESTIVPHNDETATEHGFASMVPASDSTFIAVWLDGRETAQRAHNEYSDLDKAMTLRGALIDNKGNIIENYLIDDSVCDCCNTSITKTNDGYVLVYRNRTENEIRDIYISTFKDGKWSAPTSVNDDHWKIAACPVNGPSIDADNQILAVSWFTGADSQEKVQLVISNDDGNTFKSPILVDDKRPVGRVKTEIHKNKIWVSWLASAEDGGTLNIASYSFSGKLQNSYSISDISEQRGTGFPQISASGDNLIIAYTDVSEEHDRIRIFKLM